MPHDPVRVADTLGWLRKVALDLRSADADSSADPPILEDVLFHSQQAVEKALKAYLTWHQVPFGKTHDLRQLSKICATIDPTLPQELSAAIPLTRYAWQFRYPGSPDEPTPEEAAEAIETARKAVRVLLTRLPEDVRSQAEPPLGGR